MTRSHHGQSKGARQREERTQTQQWAIVDEFEGQKQLEPGVGDKMATGPEVRTLGTS